MDFCKIQFSTVWLRDNSEVMKQTGGRMSCPRCQGNFTTAASLTTHLESCRTRAPHETTSDPTTAGSGDVRYRYIRVQHTDPLDASNKTASFIPLLLERPFSCNVCQRAFSTQGGLKKHSRIHSTDKSHVCTVCGQAFLLASYLKRHMLLHTGVTDLKPYRCDQCQMPFLTSGALRIHRMAHTGERPHPCLQCGKSFTTASYLLVHRRVHTGERPYTCETCGKAFARRCNLLAHRVSHTREKPHQCDRCGERFQFRKQRDEHRLKHTELIKCLYCALLFTGVAECAKHIRSHRETPEASVAHPMQFPCTRCKAVFDKLCSLREHWYSCPPADSPQPTQNRPGDERPSYNFEEDSFDQKPVICEDCGAGFSRTVDLEEHVLAHIDGEQSGWPNGHAFKRDPIN